MNNAEISVLIAEDNFLVSKEIERQLKQLDYKIAGCAYDGEDALAQVGKLKPDVVLLDIDMPKLDGLSVARNLSAVCPTAVVILSAFEGPELLEKASENGVGAYLCKPPEPAAIERAITIAIARHQDICKWRELSEELREKNHALEQANLQIETLRGILPICSKCKNIREQDGSWETIERYIEERTEAMFTHSLCFDCEVDIYGQESWYDKDKAAARRKKST